MFPDNLTSDAKGAVSDPDGNILVDESGNITSDGMASLSETMPYLQLDVLAGENGNEVVNLDTALNIGAIVRFIQKKLGN